MNDFLFVSITNGVCDLTQKVQAKIDGRCRTVLLQVVIQPNGPLKILKKKCRAAFVLLEIRRTQDPRMVDALEHPKLALGGSTLYAFIAAQGNQWFVQGITMRLVFGLVFAAGYAMLMYDLLSIGKRRPSGETLRTQVTGSAA